MMELSISACGTRFREFMFRNWQKCISIIWLNIKREKLLYSSVYMACGIFVNKSLGFFGTSVNWPVIAQQPSSEIGFEITYFQGDFLILRYSGRHAPQVPTFGEMVGMFAVLRARYGHLPKVAFLLGKFNHKTCLPENWLLLSPLASPNNPYHWVQLLWGDR